MATLRTVYVDPDAAGAGTGVDWTNAYTSLNAAEQAEDNTGGLVANDQYIIFHCRSLSGTADTAAVSISGWTTDATRYITIQVDQADRHAGIWSALKYRLTVADADAIVMDEDYIRIDGLQVAVTSQTTTRRALYITGAGVDWISNLIIQGCASASQFFGVSQPTASTTYIWNIIVYNTGSGAGSCIYCGAGTVNIYSSTIRGQSGGYGIRRGAGTLVAKNCYAYGAAASAYYGTMTLTTCASSDTTGSVGLQSIAVNTTNFTNVSAGTEDFHLPLGSALINVGTDTSGDAAPLNFTTDIDAQTRSGTWDVGADEYVAAGGAATPQLMMMGMGP